MSIELAAADGSIAGTSVTALCGSRGTRRMGCLFVRTLREDNRYRPEDELRRP